MKRVLYINKKKRVTRAVVREGEGYVKGSIASVVCLGQEKLIETIPGDSGFEWQQVLKLGLSSARQ